jgi:hypothetical protein
MGASASLANSAPPTWGISTVTRRCDTSHGGADIPGRAARGSTKRKATCGSAPPVLIRPCKVADPRLCSRHVRLCRRPPSPSTDQGGGKRHTGKLNAPAGVCASTNTSGFRTWRNFRSTAPLGAKHSDVPSQALSAQLIALLPPCWLEGLCDRSCRGEGRT